MIEVLKEEGQFPVVLGFGTSAIKQKLTLKAAIELQNKLAELINADTDAGANVPLDRLVMPYAEYSNDQLKFIANSGSSLVCAYLKEHSVFDAESIKIHLAIANVAAAEELKKRAKA